MKSRVYVMFLAVLMGMSGKLFAADNANGAPDYSHYDQYLQGLNFDQLAKEYSKAEEELLAAKKEKEAREREYPEEKEALMKWSLQYSAINEKRPPVEASPFPELTKANYKSAEAYVRHLLVKKAWEQKTPEDPSQYIKGAD